jgi:hypothetical protein
VIFGVFSTLEVSGCASEAVPPSGDERAIVIRGVLIAGRSTQSVAVNWASTALVPTDLAAPGAAEVHLWVVDPTHDSVPLIATDSAGFYSIAMSPAEGGQYLLVGDVAGRAIHGSTTIPATFSFSASLPPDSARDVGGVHEYLVSYRVTGSNSRGYIVNYGSALPIFVTDSTGIEGVQITPTTPRPYYYRILAPDINLLAVGAGNSTSTVFGAVGYFASGTVDSLLLPLRP